MIILLLYYLPPLVQECLLLQLYHLQCLLMVLSKQRVHVYVHACVFVDLLPALHKYLVHIHFQQEAEVSHPTDHLHERRKLSNKLGRAA